MRCWRLFVREPPEARGTLSRASRQMRVLIIYSFDDDTSKRRYAGLKQTAHLQSYDFHQDFAWPSPDSPQDAEGLFARIRASIDIVKPAVLLTHTGVAYDSSPHAFEVCIRRIKDQYPDLRLGMERRGSKTEALERVPVFEHSDEMATIEADFFSGGSRSAPRTLRDQMPFANPSQREDTDVSTASRSTWADPPESRAKPRTRNAGTRIVLLGVGAVIAFVALRLLLTGTSPSRPRTVLARQSDTSTALEHRDTDASSNRQVEANDLVTSRPADETAIRATLASTAQTLQSMNYGSLSANSRTQYDLAKSFGRIANEALREHNLPVAKSLASKSEIIARQLTRR